MCLRAVADAVRRWLSGGPFSFRRNMFRKLENIFCGDSVPSCPSTSDWQWVSFWPLPGPEKRDPVLTNEHINLYVCYSKTYFVVYRQNVSKYSKHGLLWYASDLKTFPLAIPHCFVDSSDSNKFIEQKCIAPIKPCWKLMVIFAGGN